MSEHNYRLLVKVEHIALEEHEYITVSRIKVDGDEVVLYGLQPTDTDILDAGLTWFSGSFDDHRAAEERSYQKFPLVHVPTDDYRITVPSNGEEARDDDTTIQTESERQDVREAAREYREKTE